MPSPHWLQRLLSARHRPIGCSVLATHAKAQGATCCGTCGESFKELQVLRNLIMWWWFGCRIMYKSCLHEITILLLLLNNTLVISQMPSFFFCCFMLLLLLESVTFFLILTDVCSLFLHIGVLLHHLQHDYLCLVLCVIWFLSILSLFKIIHCVTAREEGHGWFARTGWCLDRILFLAFNFLVASITHWSFLDFRSLSGKSLSCMTSI